jgi:hypothetical protein
MKGDMRAQAKTTCIGCGGDASAPHQIHRLEGGQPCPVCTRRALEAPGRALPAAPQPFSLLPGGLALLGPRRLVPGLALAARRYEDPPEPA